MECGLILFVATLVVYASQGVQGTAHLSFSNNTEVDISRTGCEETKLCRETPLNCDPTGSGICLFASAATTTDAAPVPPNGFELSIELRGDSNGYVGLGLTANASMGITMLFICGSNSANNGSFFFRTLQINNTNNELTPTETLVREIRGAVAGDVIQCEFIIRNVNATNTRGNGNDSSTFSILLGTGTANGNVVGPFNVALNTGSVNVRDPTGMVVASGAAVQPHAVLLLLSVLTLSVMLKEGLCC